MPLKMNDGTMSAFFDDEGMHINGGAKALAPGYKNRFQMVSNGVRRFQYLTSKLTINKASRHFYHFWVRFR